jgi:hypothetical protein
LRIARRFATELPYRDTGDTLERRGMSKDPRDAPSGETVSPASENSDTAAAASYFVAPPVPRHNRVIVPMALIAAFIAGVAITGAMTDPPLPAPRAAPGWVEAVAAHQALFTPQSVAGAAQPVAETRAILSRFATEVGADIGAPPDLPGLSFKGARLLGHRAIAVLHLSYADAEGRPVALAITRARETGGDSGARDIQGIATATWTRDGLDFLLMGKDRAAIEAISGNEAEP